MSHATPPPSHSIERLLEERTWLRSLAQRLVGPSDADDLVQDASIVAWQRQRDAVATGHELPSKGWLVGVMRRLALATRRKAGGQREREQAYAGERQRDPERSLASSAEQLAEQAEIENLVVAEMLRLEGPLRDTLLLRFQGGLDTAAIADRSDLHPSTVRRHVSEGVAALRKRLDEVSGGRERWAPALAAIPWAAAPTAAKSTAFTLPASLSFALTATMKKVAFAAVVALVGVGWVTRHEWLGNPSDTYVEAVGSSLGRPADLAPEESVESLTPSKGAGRLAASPGDAGLPEDAALPKTRYRWVDANGAPLKLSAARAVNDDKAYALEERGNGEWSMAEAVAEAFDMDSAGAAVSGEVPIVASRDSAWPHTFLAPTTPGMHTLSWPMGLTVTGQLLEDGVEPGEAIELELQRDVGWSDRPFAAVLERASVALDCRVVSDAEGRFTLHDLPDDWRGMLAVNDPWAFQGGSTTSRAFTAATEEHLALEVTRRPRIAGQVVAAEGRQPIGGSIERSDGSLSYTGSADESGRFVLDGCPMNAQLLFGFDAFNGDWVEAPLLARHIHDSAPHEYDGLSGRRWRAPLERNLGRSEQRGAERHRRSPDPQR